MAAIAGLSNLLGRGLTGLVAKGGVNPGRLGGIRSVISKNSGLIDTVGNILPYAPSVLQGLGGDPLAGAASGGATALAGKYGIGGKHKAATQALTGIVAPMVMPSLLGGVGQAAQAVTGGVGDLITGGQQAQRERGESPTRTGLGEGKSIDQLTIDELRELAMVNPEVAERLNPMMNQNLDRQMQRQMQLNQQLGQLTGALNQQKYMAQLAGGAQQEAGATTRQMITAQNPYAASVFQYGG